MVENFDQSVKDKQLVKDQLGERDNYTPVLSRWKTEEYNVYVKACRIKRYTLGDAFVLGHDTNSKLDGNFKLSGRNTGSESTLASISGNKFVTDAGRALLLQWLAGESVDGFTWLAYGTGSTAQNRADTALVSETVRHETFTYGGNV